ncbi:restriction endonuclease subunit S [Exiguobacterium sp. SL-9]|uniref:restriction endonuclease subunit S n=1 Tax=Exiguobacterium sp. SL-9 TaxID=2510963 RepID=UPI00103B11C9|nr:restriction endonuclease subunit S [Exiguobacterium sp. SL-9]TCI20454.1 restriction endonuclease subunit S [Exiguobacterium sp. SL-9]
MTEQTNLVPKRRFKEFENTSAWKQSMLGDVIEGLYNGQTPSRFRSDFWNGDINWLTSGELNRSIVKTTIEKITMAGQTDANLRIVPKNTFVLAITGLEAAGTRGNCGILGIDTTLNQSCMALYPNKELLSTHFLFQWYKLVGEDYGLRYTQGTKQQSYNAEIIKNLEICLPQVKEQKKIGRFFKHLDHLIILQQRKLEKTKALKAAYLSEMFPAEGEVVPKRRFAGFTQKWEESEFQNIFSYMQNNALSRADLNYENGYALNLHYGDILTKFGEYLDVSNNKLPRVSNELVVAKYKSSFLKNGDVVIADAAEDETVGKCTEIAGLGDKDMLAGLHTIACRPNRDFASGYLGYYMNSFAYHDQLLRLIQGTKVSSISKSALKTTIIKFPKDINEQKKIGNFFKQLDDIITHHQRKLEKLQNLKKAYLTEMFV